MQRAHLCRCAVTGSGSNKVEFLPVWPYMGSFGPNLALCYGGGGAMSFGLYLIGYIVLICGIAYGAFLMHVPSHWIGVTVLVLVVLGIVTGVANTRQRDPS